MEHIVEIVQDIANEIDLLWNHKYGSVCLTDIDFDYDLSFIDEMVELLTEGVTSILKFEGSREGWTNHDYEIMVGLVDEQVTNVNERINELNLTVLTHHLYPAQHPHIGPILGWSEDYGLFVWARSGILGYASGRVMHLSAAAA